MAATRKSALRDPDWIDRTRGKIRAALLINRLQDHILNGIEMSQTQVRAAEILLRKCIPDLEATEITGKNGGPIEHEDVGADQIYRRIAGIASRTGDESVPRRTNGHGGTTH